MAIPFCYHAAGLSVIEEGESRWHVNKALGEVADAGAVDWHAQPPRWGASAGHRDSSALLGRLKVPLKRACSFLVYGHLFFQV